MLDNQFPSEKLLAEAIALHAANHASSLPPSVATSIINIATDDFNSGISGATCYQSARIALNKTAEIAVDIQKICDEQGVNNASQMTNFVRHAGRMLADNRPYEKIIELIKLSAIAYVKVRDMGIDYAPGQTAEEVIV